MKGHKQSTFRDACMATKSLRVERFLGEMEQVIPWHALCDELSKTYQDGQGGRPAHDLLMMIKIHCLQLWHNLSDLQTEEAIYDRLSFQKFLGLNCFGQTPIPDQSSILRFRHFLEKHAHADLILEVINRHLSNAGLVVKSGTIVDATLFQAPISKKNKETCRDPEMSSTRKNNKWYFGAKGHIGVQSHGKPLVHSTHFSTAKDHDKVHMTKLFHGEEQAIFGDSGYTHQEEKRGSRRMGLFYGVSDRAASHHPLSNKQKKRNQKIARIRAKVEHPFQVIKARWGHYKLRYRGLRKNAVRFTTLCALSNIYFCRKELLSLG